MIDPEAKALAKEYLAKNSLPSIIVRERLSHGTENTNLSKHYTDVCISVSFCGFNVDPALNNCVDGLL